MQQTLSDHIASLEKQIVASDEPSRKPSISSAGRMKSSNEYKLTDSETTVMQSTAPAWIAGDR